MKLQVSTGASGLLEAVFGAIVGRKHDISLWRASGVARDIDRLRAAAIVPDGPGGAPADNRWFAVGDAAYKGDREHVLIPHDRTTVLTAAQRDFNKHLSRTRVSVRARRLVGRLRNRHSIQFKSAGDSAMRIHTPPATAPHSTTPPHNLPLFTLKHP